MEPDSFAFNIQWPTLLTLLMAPVLIVASVHQARRENAGLKARFGRAFAHYAANVAAFSPRFRRLDLPATGPLNFFAMKPGEVAATAP